MRLILIISILLAAFNLKAQEQGGRFEDKETNLWLSSYNKFRITEKLYWAAELHYRRIGNEAGPYVGQMAQMYNRHGLNYVVSPNFNFTMGGVLRLDFSPEPENETMEPIIPEPRIWHQYMFVTPWPRFMVYNRIRIEHRWNRTSRENSDWIFRNRWRYMFFMKIPINNRQLVPGTFYISPSTEIIMQTGAPVTGSFVEDLRFYTSIGYIANPRFTSSLGLMYTTGQNLNDPMLYRRRWIIRLSTYISLDFRKEERKIPSIRLLD